MEGRDLPKTYTLSGQAGAPNAGSQAMGSSSLAHVLALSQVSRRPLGPRSCSCPGHTGSAVLAGLSANCSIEALDASAKGHCQQFGEVARSLPL